MKKFKLFNEKLFASLLYDFLLIFAGFAFGSNWTDDPDIARMLLDHPPLEDALFYAYLFAIIVLLLHGITALFSFFKKRNKNDSAGNNDNSDRYRDPGDLAE